MVKTRAMAEMEMKQFFELMQSIKNGQEEIKAGQRIQEERLEEMKANIVSVLNPKVDIISEKVEKNEERLGEMEKIIEKNEGRFGEIEKKMEREIDKLKEAMNVGLSSEKSKFAVENIRGTEISQDQPILAKPNIKLSTYDGKTSWQVYKTQFAIVADGNGWDPVTKARQLAASLRAEAADVLRTIPEEQQVNFETLTETLELRFGEKYLKDFNRLQLKSRQQRQNETLQDLATDVERLSHLAFNDYPADIRDTLALQYFIDGVKDPEIQKALRLAELKDLKSALVYGLKYEAAQQASRRDRHQVRGAAVSDVDMAEILKELRDIVLSLNAKSNRNTQKKNVMCWRCGAEGHIQRSCQARQDQRADNVTRTKKQEN